MWQISGIRIACPRAGFAGPLGSLLYLRSWAAGGPSAARDVGGLAPSRLMLGHQTDLLSSGAAMPATVLEP
jgi:hypothetical protein